MDSGSTAAPEVQFQLAVPPELAHELAGIPGVKATVATEAPSRIQHELALETVALVVTIAVNAQELVPTCERLAKAIHRFFSRSTQRQCRVKVIGERDEAVIEVRIEGAAETADSIRVTVTR